MVKESLAELQKAAEEIRDGLKNVNEDIKKLTGRDPTENLRAGNRRIQLKRNSFQRGVRTENPIAKQRRESDTIGARRWGRTVEAGSRISVDEQRLDSSGDEDDSSKPAIQSVIASDLKPARVQSNNAEEDSGTKSRNRRMFGFLVGTLQRFKEDTRQKTRGEKKREEIEKKLEEKAAQEKQELITQKRELFQARREKQQELKFLETKMENAVLKEEILEHNKHLGNFIRLKCNPPLFYLPVKHTEETKRLLEETKTTLKDLQNTRFKALDFEDDAELNTSMSISVDTGKEVKNESVKAREVGHRGLFDKDRDQLEEKEETEMGKIEGENGLSEGEHQIGEVNELFEGRSDREKLEKVDNEEVVSSKLLISNANVPGGEIQGDESLCEDKENIEGEMNAERNGEKEMGEELTKREGENEEARDCDRGKSENFGNFNSSQFSTVEASHDIATDKQETLQDTTSMDNNENLATSTQELPSSDFTSIPMIAEPGDLTALPTNPEGDEASMKVGY
ncbi:pinin-like [Rhopilema esculentum]|uniref:pinin-like n=1 Tax=Rhopilema esculentum TaxID=499914 RepID=UPI0031D1AAE6|eukprot:gene3230-1551_t